MEDDVGEAGGVGEVAMEASYIVEGAKVGAGEEEGGVGGGEEVELRRERVEGAEGVAEAILFAEAADEIVDVLLIVMLDLGEKRRPKGRSRCDGCGGGSSRVFDHYCLLFQVFEFIKATVNV